MRADERNRIVTFKNYPHSSIKSALLLAESGFVYIGDGSNGDDRVECEFCRCSVSNWQYKDDIQQVHKQKSPTCFMVLCFDSGDIDIPRPSGFSLELERLFDGIKERCYDIKISQVTNSPESILNSELRTNHPAIKNNELIPGIVVGKPKYPEYRGITKRLESFANWPKSYPKNPQQLSEAGLFYEDCGRLTRCFSCGNGLLISVDHLDILLEHARLSPNCPFMCLKMGHNFIEAARKSRETESLVSINHVSEIRGTTPVSFVVSRHSEDLIMDPGVQVLLDAGWPVGDVLKIVTKMDSKGEASAAIKVYEQLTGSKVSFNEEMVRLSDMNKQLRSRTICKVCTVKKASIVYIPCGHLASCLDCSDVGQLCPVCKMLSFGLIRASIR